MIIPTDVKYENLSFKVLYQVGLVTLENASKKNALTFQMIEDMNEVLDIVEQREDIRVLLFWGTEELFGAGADISHGETPITTAYESYHFSRRLQKTFARIHALSKPTIAAVAGYTLGGCLELSMACDIRFASENAKIGLPEVNLGSLPGAGGTQRLPRLVGLAKAKEIMFSGEYIGATEAERIGLVNRVVKEGTLLAEAMEYAQKLVKKAPLSLAKIKDAVDNGSSLSIDVALEYEAKCFATLFGTADREEGILAFNEKREPEFTGK